MFNEYVTSSCFLSYYILTCLTNLVNTRQVQLNPLVPGIYLKVTHT